MINVKKSDFEVFQALESDASASIGSAGSISEYYAIFVLFFKEEFVVVYSIAKLCCFSFQLLGYLVVQAVEVPNMK